MVGRARSAPSVSLATRLEHNDTLQSATLAALLCNTLTSSRHRRLDTTTRIDAAARYPPSSSRHRRLRAYAPVRLMPFAEHKSRQSWGPNLGENPTSESCATMSSTSRAPQCCRGAVFAVAALFLLLDGLTRRQADAQQGLGVIQSRAFVAASQPLRSLQDCYSRNPLATK